MMVEPRFQSQFEHLSILPEDGLSDRAKRVLLMMCKTGVPVALIEVYLDEIEQDAAAPDFDAERYRAESPLMAKWRIAFGEDDEPRS